MKSICDYLSIVYPWTDTHQQDDQYKIQSETDFQGCGEGFFLLFGFFSIGSNDTFDHLYIVNGVGFRVFKQIDFFGFH